MSNHANASTITNTHPNNPYVHSTPAPAHNPYVHSTPAPAPPSASQAFHNIGRKFESAAKKTENFVGNLYNHLRTGPGVIDVAMTRVDQAARVIADGGCDNIFRREFGNIPGEKIRKAYACYLSTTVGKVLGTLYISTKRVAFRSDYPVWSSHGGEWVYYKVVIMLDQIVAVKPSTNLASPTEKYIEIMTKDGHEFWFLGFVFYDEANKNLNKAIHSLSGY